MKRLVGFALTIFLVLAIAACGGGSDDGDNDGDDAGSDPTSAATQAPDDSNSGDDDDDGGNDDGGDDDGDAPGSESATVTIGDETWEFELSSRFAACIALGGAIGAVGPAADGTSVTVDISLPPEDWESQPAGDWDAPSLRINDKATDRDWRAGGDIMADVLAGVGASEDLSMVTSFSIDGSSASGTASFVEMRALQLAGASGEALPDAVQGTFEVSCG